MAAKITSKIWRATYNSLKGDRVPRHGPMSCKWNVGPSSICGSKLGSGFFIFIFPQKFTWQKSVNSEVFIKTLISVADIHFWIPIRMRCLRWPDKLWFLLGSSFLLTISASVVGCITRRLARFTERGCANFTKLRTERTQFRSISSTGELVCSCNLFDYSSLR